MSLPIVETPEYTLTLPSTGEEVRFRPFLVKEEKIFLMALESRQPGEMVKALRQVIEACTFGQLDINKLPNFDLEYIFIQLRSKSVGEKIRVELKSTDGDPEHTNEIEINLNDVEIRRDENHDRNIQLTDNIGITMRYPVFEDMVAYMDQAQKFDQSIELVTNCIESVYTSDGQVNMMADETDEAKQNFIDSLQKAHIEKIMNFFETMPRVVVEVKYHDKWTNKDEKLTLEGIESFFI